MIANLVVGGLAAGCLYAMVGIAIVIVLNITDIANFAQGEMAMLATFFAYWLMDSIGLPWWQAVSIAIVFGLVQGIVIQQVVIRPLIGGPVLVGDHRDARAQCRAQQRGRHDLGSSDLYLSVAVRVLGAVHGRRRSDRGRQRRQHRRRPRHHRRA